MGMTRGNKKIETANMEMGLRKTCISDEEADKRLEKEATIYAKHFIDILPPNISFSPENVFEDIKDGVVLGHVLHSIKNNCIETKKLVKCNKDIMDKKFLYEATTNLAYVLGAAKKIGIKIVNIGAEDIIYENKGLVLGLLWQLVRLSVSKKSNVLRNPEFMNLKRDNESIEDLCNRSPEEMCLRWINYHIQKAKDEGLDQKITEFIHHKAYFSKNTTTSDVHAVFSACYKSDNGDLDKFIENVLNIDNIKFPEKCSNFTNDLKDSRIYLILLRELVPQYIDDNLFMEIWFDFDLNRRARKVLEIAEKIDCKKFVTENEIVKGATRLNFLFCQTIMNKFPGMESGENIEMLRQKIYEYENNILDLEESLSAAQLTVKEKEKIEKEKEIREEELKRTLEEKTEEYETVIDDLRVSQDSFSYKIENYVEEALGISQKCELRDSNERIWSTVTSLISEVKIARSERDEAKEKLERLREINNLIDIKLQEYIEYERRAKAKREKKRKFCSSFFGCE